MRKLAGFLCVLMMLAWLPLSSYASTEMDPLPSWQAGPAKKSIIQFVNAVSDKANPNFVPLADRIAAFDNDGTLWVEQPVYTQAIFMLAELKRLAKQHPEWQKQQPFSVLLSGGLKALTTLSAKDIERVVAITHSGMTTDAFRKLVSEWLKEAKNPRFQKPYPALIYQPMLEVMRYLRAHEFTIYIVTGGGQDFVRAFAKETYDVAEDKVIGTATKTEYQPKDATLIKMPQILIVDDHAGKPEAMHFFIGKKPIIAFGNSDGDQQMLEWTQSGPGLRGMYLVHHDDSKREYAYGPETKVGTFSNALMQEAKQRKWQLISMKNDWRIIFPFEKGISAHD